MRVDFYLLQGQKTSAEVITSLVQKAQHKKWRIGIYLDKDAIPLISDALWQSHPESFFAHDIISTTRCQSSVAPIVLFYSPPDDVNTLDYYINVSQSDSQYHNPQGRIADIVFNAAKDAGRARYVAFKQSASTLHFHEIA